MPREKQYFAKYFDPSANSSMDHPDYNPEGSSQPYGESDENPPTKSPPPTNHPRNSARDHMESLPMSSFGCPSYTHTKGSVVVVVVGDHPGPYPQLQAHIYLLQHQVLMQPRWPNRKISSSVADLDPIGSTSFASLSDK